MPIDGELVKAALKLSGLTVSEAAERTGIPQQTINSWVHCEVGTCEPDNRRALAKLLGVGSIEDVLAGVTHMPWSEFQLRVAPRADGGPFPARAEYAAFRVATRIADAWARDINRGLVPRPPFPEGWIEETDQERFEKYRQSRLELLLSPWRWRLALFPAAAVGWRVAADAADAFVPAFAAALEALLEPWLLGRQPLNYGAFYRLLEWLCHLPLAEVIVHREMTEAEMHVAAIGVVLERGLPVSQELADLLAVRMAPL